MLMQNDNTKVTKLSYSSKHSPNFGANTS